LLKLRKDKAENTRLDTRNKIVPLDQVPALLGTTPWLAVVGLFDPLTAIEAKRLAGLARPDRKLLAVVLESENALLSPEARAELVAALRDVHLVATAKRECWQFVMPHRAGFQIIEDPEGDKTRSAEFIQFVLNRQQSAAVSAGRND
jgi:hypothetical protein